MSRSRLVVAGAALALVGLALSACTADPAPRVTKPSAHATPLGDGVLTIGAVFPATGSASYLGPAQASGVDAAAKAINAAGGVLGKPVVVIHEDSGDVSTGAMEAAVNDLVTKKADVIIGPSSSVLAERVLPKTTAAKLPMISPAATSVRLTGLGKGGWFFRTVPSAAAQGTVLAKAIGNGKAKIALVYLDDQTGQAILSTLTAGLAASGGKLVSTQPFQTDTTDFSAIIAAVKASAPDDVVFVSPFSAMAQNKSVITGLNAAGLGGAKLWLTSENMADYSQALPVGTLTNVNGVLEGVTPTAAFKAEITATNPAVTDFLFAAESYDATILAALAAVTGKDDSGTAIAANLRSVSSTGIKCTTFKECVDAYRDSGDIDYDGQTGDIAFDASGDPHPAHYGVYRYDGQNRFALVGSAEG
ncbi:MAG: amino acid transporter substrate-binding protein [Microbacteriaceae bacterium]|nr:amino acid transporter substrate-binding protein [Microbacteriaceae bacterium]